MIVSTSGGGTSLMTPVLETRTMIDAESEEWEAVDVVVVVVAAAIETEDKANHLVQHTDRRYRQQPPTTALCQLF
jgi:hypothetical protein